MAEKISGMTPKGAAMATTDLIEASVDLGGGSYGTRSLTGADIIAGIPSGITIGTTAITSGTNTRVLYQSGGVVSQSANFVFDASNQLVIGGHTGGAKLDVKAGGALSTDMAFRVRNSADTANIFQINGDSSGGWNVDGNAIKFGSGSRISTGANYLDAFVIGFSLYNCALSTAFQAQGNSINNLKQICLGGAYDDNEASAIFYNIVGTPTVAVNSFKMYANDIVAGNAAPHFRTEAGDIVKLFKGAAVADAAGGVVVDIEARAAINALISRFRVTGGNGLIAN